MLIVAVPTEGRRFILALPSRVLTVTLGSRVLLRMYVGSALVGGRAWQVQFRCSTWLFFRLTPFSTTSSSTCPCRRHKVSRSIETFCSPLFLALFVASRL